MMISKGIIIFMHFQRFSKRFIIVEGLSDIGYSLVDLLSSDIKNAIG